VRQTKREAAIEVLTGTGIGMLGSWLITLFVMSCLPDKLQAATVTVLLCTLWSLLRGFAIRRYFSKEQL
jgi:hypothetical protein